LIGRTLSHFKIIDRIGEGGMGIVYRAEDTRLQRHVALKVLPPHLTANEERRLRFLREARTAAAINHSNIATIYEIDEVEGVVFIAMELIEGRTLRETIQGKALPVKEALRLATGIAEGLAQAHRANVIHRDLKPDNILVSAGGQVKILDFGLAKLLEEPGSSGDAGTSKLATMSGEMTREGKILGTAAYMSPEQARGKAVDARSDLFSFGSTLYEMTTGQAPFQGPTATDILSAIIRDQPALPSRRNAEVPQELDRIISGCLEKDPADRYQHAEQLAVDLRKLRRAADSGAHAIPTASGPLAAAAVSEPATVPARAPGRSFGFAAAALLAVIAGLIIWVVSRQAPGPDAPAAPLATLAAIQLAVLPLQNVRDDARIDFLGFALADAVISKLSYLRAVTVRPSSYIQKYRDQLPDPQQVGEELGVDHLLTGSLLAQGDALRISVQYVDLQQGAVRWEETIDASLDNLMAVQDEVVTRIVEGMRLNLTAEEASQLSLDRPRDPEAFDLFLRARALPETVYGNGQAIAMLGDSVARDARFAPAWVELSSRHQSNALYTGGNTADYEAAERSVLRALEINPDSPAALWQHAIMLTERDRHEEAHQRLQSWLQTDPFAAEAHFVLSYLYRYTGMLEEGEQELEQALLLDPRNPGFRSGGHIFIYNGEFERADAVFRLDGDSAYTLAHLATTAHLRGEYDNARALSHKVIAADPGGRLAETARAWLRMYDGDRVGAAAILQGLAPILAPDPELLYEIAADLAWAGAYDTSRDLFTRAVEGGFYCYPAFLNDPRLQAPLARPEFAGVLATARRRHDSFRAYVAGSQGR
jgi:TolB-like protein/Tfp pilus assembly protein PilF/predicted Ser/Thr protein kinase